MNIDRMEHAVGGPTSDASGLPQGLNATLSSAAQAAGKVTSNIGTDVLLHYSFKVGAFLTYQFGPLFFGGIKKDDFVFTFVITVLLLCCDFWVVKNVTGWHMAGLAWFYSEDEDAGVDNCTKNEGHWYFQYATSDDNMGLAWKSFWIGLILWPVYWLCSGLSYFFSLNWDWVVVAMIGLSLSGINFTGYWKGSKYSDSNSLQNWLFQDPIISQAMSLYKMIPWISRASESGTLPK